MAWRIISLLSGFLHLLTITAFAGEIDFQRADNHLSVLGYHEGQLLVRFKEDTSESVMALTHAPIGGRKIKAFETVKNLHLVSLPQEMSVRSAIGLYRKDERVLYAEPNYVLKALAMPDDPSFGLQWGLHNTGQEGGIPGADIHAPEAWDLNTGDRGVVVAVIDTGVESSHADLAANIWRNVADCNYNGIDDDGNGYVDDCYGIDTVNGDSYPEDDNGHGTYVSGIIGAAGNNGTGVAGVSWNVSIMACKFLDAYGYGDISGAIACLDYVKKMKDRGVDVVATNNSWGGVYFSQALFDAIDAHRQAGILCIAAAGNDGWDNDTYSIFPANYHLPNIISVAATDRRDRLASYSNQGRRMVHLGAPGTEILSTIIGSAYATCETCGGTSMAAPHVAGVAALLKADDPSRDWKIIKNLILAGGDSIPSLTNTITQKRLNAYGALRCSDSLILSRLLPTENTINTSIGRPIDLSALHINCETPAGEVNVTIEPGDVVVTLKDDGHGTDQEEGDGIYSGQWAPSEGGTFTLTFPGGDTVTANVDPDLEAGFPVKAFFSPGLYHYGVYRNGPAIHTLVGNIDDHPDLEIVATGLDNGPLYAWHAHGTPVWGWPPNDILWIGYPAMGNLSGQFDRFNVVSGFWDGYWDFSFLSAYSGSGDVLPGWPVNAANFVSSPPSLADVDGDGLDEIFVGEEDWGLHAYRADGSILTGWPAYDWVGDQERHTPAIADLDGDGNLEIITASGSSSGQVYLFAYHHDGSPVEGFPVTFDGFTHTYPVIGDVDGDGALEIVVVGLISGKTGVYIFSGDGRMKVSMAAAGDVLYGTAPALADLDGDSIPEIIVQTNTGLNVWRGDGSTFPGWPVVFEGGDFWVGNSSPVVGDVDGDGAPDIVVTNQDCHTTCNQGQVRVYDRNGVLHPRFPKVLMIGDGAVPAIADIDRDGRNEIIITGDRSDDFVGYADKVWVYDLGGPAHGPVLWGQFGGGPQHQGVYPRPTETISTPSPPSGPTEGSPGVTYSYSTGGSVSGLEHSVQYFFDWGDGTNSGWLPVDEAITSKTWDFVGSYRVRARARCAQHKGAVSSWSVPLPVNIIVDDKTPPAPDPMTWQNPPYQTGTSSISMVGTPATDPTPPIRYSFHFVDSPTGGTGGTDSGWQAEVSYTNSSLQPNHQYGYQIKAKDGMNNETGYSRTQYAYTAIESPAGIKIGKITSTSIEAQSINTPSGLDRGGSGLLIENVTNGTNSGWKQSNDFWTSNSLSPNTRYVFQAKARNGDTIETGYSSPASKYTWANGPGLASFSNVAWTCIRANWTANGNPNGTQYFCENTKTGTNSGWTTDLYWDSCELTSGTYSFRVKAKNGDGIETEWVPLGSQSTLGMNVLLPNGGENWRAGTKQMIQWDYSGDPGTHVKIELLKGGVFNRTIKKRIKIGENGVGTYSWRIPRKQISGNDYQIRITSITDNSYTDTSDNNFTISR